MLESLAGRGQGEKKGPGLALQPKKTVVLIERDRSVILCVHEQRERRRCSSNRSCCCVGEGRRAELAALKGSTDRQSADANGRKDGIPRQSPGNLRWKILHRDARCGERTKAGYRAGRCFDGYKAARDVPADVLRYLRPEVPIEDRFATFEERPIMIGGERLKRETVAMIKARGK
jgi:hypothetical protein